MLKQNAVDCEREQFEMIDLFVGKHFTGEPIRPSTLKLLDELARLIESQWTTIGP